MTTMNSMLPHRIQVTSSCMSLEYIKVMKDALGAFLQEIAGIYASHQATPSQNSKARSEQSTFANPESVVTNWATAGMLLESSGEHVSAFLKALSEPVETFACYTCVRASLESAALAAWLLDPNVDTRERIMRTFALRYEGLDQQVKFGVAAQVPAAELQAAKSRLDDIERDAKALGYLSISDKNGRRIGIGQLMPKITILIRDVLDDEPAYRLLSAVAHGHNWALSKLGYQNTGNRLLDGAGVTTTILEKSPNLLGMAFLGLRASRALARPLLNQFQYFGWDCAALTILLDRLFDKLMADEAGRFWRTN